MIERTARRDAESGYLPRVPDDGDSYGRHARPRGSAPSFDLARSVSGPRHAAPEVAPAAEWSFQPRPPDPRIARRVVIPLLAVLAVAVPVGFLVMRGPAPVPEQRTPAPVPVTATSAAHVAGNTEPAPPPVSVPVSAPPQQVPAVTVQPTYRPRRIEPSQQRKPEIGVTRTPVTRTQISAVAPAPPTTGRNSSTPGDEPGGWGPW